MPPFSKVQITYLRMYFWTEFKSVVVTLERHVDGLRHDGSRRLWFDVSEVPVEDVIVGAELRIYQSPNVSHDLSRHQHHAGSGFYTVTAYQVTQNQDG